MQTYLRSALTDEESVYYSESWLPEFIRLYTQVRNEWQRIKSAEYFGSKKLELGISGRAPALNVLLNIQTIMRSAINSQKPSLSPSP